MTTKGSARARFWVAVAILCAPPLVLGIQGTRSSEWPDDPDLFRESALAQSIADGHPLDDPYFLGEWVWYPPLVPAIVAGLSKVTGLPVPTVYARAGAWLNILGPVLFAALVARCFGPLASLVALTIFLYRIPRGPTGAVPLHSTLLYSGNFAQALFYLTLLAYVALEGKGRLRYVLTGLLLGLTFLAHAAPFVVLAVFFAIELVRDAVREPLGALRRHGLLFATAALAAAPLLVSIVGHYHLVVRNPAPTLWIAWSSTPLALGRQIDRHTLAACVALVALWVRGPRAGAWVVTGWVAAAVSLVAWSLAAATHGWPQVVPRHHVVFYARVAQPVLVGYGASALLSWAWRSLRRMGGLAKPSAALAGEPARWVATVGAALLVLVAARPARPRGDGPLGAGIVHGSTVEAGLDAYRWMRSALRSDDVVLSTDERALMVTGPAGARAVALECVFANLYVDCESRQRAREEMLAALRRGDEPRFQALADEHSVTHVLWVRADGPWFDATPFRGLALAFGNERVRIYRRTTGGT